MADIKVRVLDLPAFRAFINDLSAIVAKGEQEKYATPLDVVADISDAFEKMIESTKDDDDE